MLSKDLVAASSRPLVLTLLAAGESYGYELIRKVRELSGGRLEWTEGTLYPVLHRLEAEKIIASRWDAAAGTGRKRKYYQITATGRSALLEEQKNWQSINQILENLWTQNPPSI